MKLYAVILDRVDSDPDWFFITSKDFPNDKKIIKAIKKHQDLNNEEFNNYINEYWVESVYATGYKIKLEKE